VSLREHSKSGYLTRGQTVAALATALGIDPDNLEARVRRFNDEARDRLDRDFGRGRDAYQRYLGDADNQPNPWSHPSSMPPFIRSPSIRAILGQQRALLPRRTLAYWMMLTGQ
jgi:FAD binding domain